MLFQRFSNFEGATNLSADELVSRLKRFKENANFSSLSSSISCRFEESRKFSLSARLPYYFVSPVNLYFLGTIDESSGKTIVRGSFVVNNTAKWIVVFWWMLFQLAGVATVVASIGVFLGMVDNGLHWVTGIFLGIGIAISSNISIAFLRVSNSFRHKKILEGLESCLRLDENKQNKAGLTV